MLCMNFHEIFVRDKKQPIRIGLDLDPGNCFYFLKTVKMPCVYVVEFTTVAVPLLCIAVGKGNPSVG